MSRADQLLREAERALAAADYTSALAAFTKLEKEQPEEGLWSKRIADLHRRTQQRAEELRSLARAADRYAARGELMQAIVMCKRMLDLDPNNHEVVSRLSDLHPKLREAGHPRPKVQLRAVTIRAEIEDALPIHSSRSNPVSSFLGIESDEAISAIPLISGDDVDDAFDALATGPIEVLGTFPLTPFFAALREDSFRRLIDKLRLIPIPAGHVVFHRGDPGNSFFVISEGSVEVLLDEPERVLGRLDEGEFFGEIALITDHPRMATVRALTDTMLIEIDRRAVSELIYEDPEVMTVLLWFLRDRLVDTLIRTNEVFERIPPGERRGLAERFQFLECKRTTTLIEQGQAARGLIILLAGQARVVRDDREIAVLGPGDICGEMSLLTADPAVATVRSEGHLFALEISVAEFRALAAEHPDLLLAIEDVAERRLPLI